MRVRFLRIERNRPLGRALSTGQDVGAQQHHSAGPVRKRRDGRPLHRSGARLERARDIAHFEQQQRPHAVQPGVVGAEDQAAIQQRQRLGEPGVGNEFAQAGIDDGLVELGHADVACERYSAYSSAMPGPASTAVGRLPARIV